MDYRGKQVLITGGSSGIGLAIAKKLSSLGANIWLMARTPDKLSLAIDEVKAVSLSPDQQFGTIPADVADADQVKQGIDLLTAQAGTPDMVFNSAGVAHPGYFEDLDLQIFRWTMDINYFGTLYVTHAVIPGMIQRGSGHIINISSIAGFMGIFGYTAYGASKYAVRGFSDVLRAEMKPKGIRVSVVFPPDTETPQLAYESQFKPFETREIGGSAKEMSADAVASEIVRDVARGRYIILPGMEGKLFYRLTSLVGNLTYPVMDMLVAQAMKKKARLSERNVSGSHVQGQSSK